MLISSKLEEMTISLSLFPFLRGVIHTSVAVFLFHLLTFFRVEFYAYDTLAFTVRFKVGTFL